jgi:hypothetical protein
MNGADILIWSGETNSLVSELLEPALHIAYIAYGRLRTQNKQTLQL